MLHHIHDIHHPCCYNQHADQAAAGKGGAPGAAAAGLDGEELDLAGGWGDEDLGLPGDGDLDETGMVDAEEGEGDGEEEDGGWEMEDLELPPEALGTTASMAEDSVFVAPSAGIAAQQRWRERCQLAADQAAAGAFDTCMRLLHRQLGIVNFEPLKAQMLDLYSASHAVLPAFPGLGAEVGTTVGCRHHWCTHTLFMHLAQ